MLHINPVYDEKYIKVKEFNGLVNTSFLGNQVPKKVWIISLSIDSVKKVGKKNYPQVYLEECKYKIKK